MKTFTKIWKIFAIGAIIAAGLGACKSTPVLDEETLAAMENASWEVKPLTYFIIGATGTDFTMGDKTEAAYFGNISVTQGLDAGNYALTAPEFPDTYYYITKTRLFGKDIFYVFKSTTIDEEKFAQYNTFFTASWEVKALSGAPSLNGLEKLPDVNKIIPNPWESQYVQRVVYSKVVDSDNGVWYILTSQDVPGITYYYRGSPNSAGGTGGAVSVISADVYKNKQ